MISAKLKVAILYDVWGDEPELPQVVEPKSSAKKKKPKSKAKREKEDREEIFEALQKLGHEPFYQVLDGTPQCNVAFQVWRRPCFQPHGVVCRRRHEGNECRSLHGLARHTLHRRRPARSFSRTGQGNRQEDVRLSRH